ncbi:MAG: SDR family oxidoreductase [Steroidobacteraceae bacterium]
MSRIALVSGAASGIGLETTLSLARTGWTVYAGFRPDGRSAPKPKPQGPGLIHWLPLDVTDRAARVAAAGVIKSAHERLDALVNSAGIQASGPLEEIPEATLREVMEVNFFGAVNLTRDCLPLMRRSGGGVIVMVSSLSGLIGLPFDGVYAASKFALEGASESLRYELEPFGIKVALVEPGAYATSLSDRSSSARTGASAYAAFEQTRGRPATGTNAPDPSEAASVIVSTITEAAPQLHVPCGAQAVSVVRRLRELDETQRHELALRASGLI